MVAPIVIGMALGAAKAASDAEKEKRQRQEAATTERWSPWTGIAAQKPQSADVFGSVMQGGMAGAMMGGGGPASGAAPGATAANGTSGAIGPMANSAAYAGTPAAAAIQQGDFANYFQNQMTSPYAYMK